MGGTLSGNATRATSLVNSGISSCRSERSIWSLPFSTQYNLPQSFRDFDFANRINSIATDEMTNKEILDDDPHLESDEIREALAFAAEVVHERLWYNNERE